MLKDQKIYKIIKKRLDEEWINEQLNLSSEQSRIMLAEDISDYLIFELMNEPKKCDENCKTCKTCECGC